MIRAATIDDLDAIVAVLAQALADDPLIDTLVRPDKGRPDAIARLMREVARRYYLDQGASHVALAGSDIVGAVLALPPEASTGYGLRDSMRMVRHTIRVARLRGLWRAGQASGFLNYIHPRAPHHYLYQLGAGPEAPAGTDQALLAAVTDRADEEGRPVYVENSRPERLGLYEGHGFTREAVVTLPGGASLELLWRRPRR